MLAKLYSCAIIGLEGGLIEVEVDIAQGLPAFTLVGLPDAAVSGIAGTRAGGDQELQRHVSDAPYHRQPRPRRPEERRSGLRSADRGGDFAGDGTGGFGRIEVGVPG